MDLLFSHLLHKFFYRIAEFFRHWYGHSFRIYSHFVISILERLDRRLAFKITLLHIFHPLYQDQTAIGYILGFIFRSGRLIIGAIVYIFVIIIAVALYLIWLLIPVYIFLGILNIKIFP